MRAGGRDGRRAQESVSHVQYTLSTSEERIREFRVLAALIYGGCGIQHDGDDVGVDPAAQSVELRSSRQILRSRLARAALATSAECRAAAPNPMPTRGKLRVRGDPPDRFDRPDECNLRRRAASRS